MHKTNSVFDFTFHILQYTTAKLSIYMVIDAAVIKHMADGQVLSKTPRIFIHALLISHLLSGILSFLISLATTVRKSVEEKVCKVPLMCSDEINSLKTNTKFVLDNIVKAQKQE
jgi:hypothetical protein